MRKMKSVTIQFDSVTLSKLKKFAVSNNVSLSFVVRLLVGGANILKKEMLLTHKRIGIQ